MFNKKKYEEEEEYGFDLNADAETPLDTTRPDNIDWDSCIEEHEAKKTKKKKKEKEVSYEEFYDTKKERVGIPKYLIISLMFIFIYGCFVGFGAAITTHTSTGELQVVNVALREARKDYKNMREDYDDMNKLVEVVDKIDNSLIGSDNVDNVKYASDYKAIVDAISINVKNAQGKTYPTEYSFMQTINTNVYENMTKYCKAMSDGMSSQSKPYIDSAQNYKDIYKNQFDKYTNNINKIRELCEIGE